MTKEEFTAHFSGAFWGWFGSTSSFTKRTLLSCDLQRDDVFSHPLPENLGWGVFGAGLLTDGGLLNPLPSFHSALSVKTTISTDDGRVVASNVATKLEVPWWQGVASGIELVRFLRPADEDRRSGRILAIEVIHGKEQLIKLLGPSPSLYVGRVANK